MNSSADRRFLPLALCLVLSAAACTTSAVGELPSPSRHAAATPRSGARGGSQLPPKAATGEGTATKNDPEPVSNEPAADDTGAPSESTPEPPPAPPTSPSPPSPPSPPLPNEPTFVAAGESSLVIAGTEMPLLTPPAIQDDDLLIALIDADEGTSSRVVTPPVGWTLVPGFPVHNLASAYPKYSPPASQSHGTWIFFKLVAVGEPATASFEFPSATTARGAVVSYRGVDPVHPIHDKSAYGFFGYGDTNGYGGGNSTLLHGLQVNLFATAWTAHPTYSLTKTSSYIHERFNSGEQPNGLNLIVQDRSIINNGASSYFLAGSLDNMRSPSASADTFMFTGTTLVLTPK